jgi:hypothetical protein
MAAIAEVLEMPDPEGAPEQRPTRRIVFMMGGKGGIGKTAFATMLVEWYCARSVAHTLLDMDTENKEPGSLQHFFPSARKANVQRAQGIDDFIHVLDDGAELVVADMGGGAGEVAHRWFDSMYEAAHENGVAFTAVGLVTPDPASVSSILSWGKFLKKRVAYLIVRNALGDPADFGYWDTDPNVQRFREMLQPKEISMEYRLPKIEHEARNAGLTMQAVASRKATNHPVLSQTASVWRAQAYRRNLFAELDRVKDLLLV